MQSKMNFVKSLLSVLFLTVPWCAVATGKVIYVDDDAFFIGVGTSWTDAFCCLQDALAEAGVGDEIRVAEGVYKPDRRVEKSGRIGAQVIASGEWTATFELVEGITMKGGYAGYGESDPNARDVELYETILSGDLYSNDIDVNDPEDMWEATTRAENSYHVVTGGGGVEDAVAILDGFTITGGNANVSSYYNGIGGGLYNQRCTIRITNCTFTMNFALFDGGGLYNDQGDLSLINCKFVKNLVRSGGGAGIYNYRSNISQNNCTFIENLAQYGEGGGVNNDECDPNLTNCIFIENSARAGGGIYNRYSSPTLTNCVLIGNSVRDQGGGVHNFNRNTSSPVLRNCLFLGNSAGYSGGGVYNYWGGPVLTNCTFAWNSAENGNAVACRSDHERNIVTLTNCVLWDGGDEIWSSELSIINIVYSDVYGGWFGEGNIDTDPLFADPYGPDDIPGTEDDNLRPAPLSPCIDAGDPQYVSGPNETDIDGNSRVASGRVDMGAYEFSGIIYVDNYGLDEPTQIDSIEDGSEAHPFHTIQKAINMAKDGQIVLVRPGVYPKIDFMGKAITVAGTNGAAVIEALTETGRIVQKEDAVTFHTGEGPDSVLKNFIIRDSSIAVSLNYGSSPTIRNLTIVDNDFGISAYENSNPDISNCIFFNNRDGDLFQCEVRFSCLEDETPGVGNISADPLFADAAGGDYHLMSEGWRWNMQNGSWTWDFVTSPCIDAGDPTMPLGAEPMSVLRDPSNDYGINLRINMGAYGGTCQASMAPPGWFLEYETDPPVPNPAQWARDGKPREFYGGGGTFDYYVRMIAAEATDASGPVEYFFECTTVAGFSSGWQSARNYEVLVGRAGQGHRFRVKARDQFGNETAWSEELSTD